MRTEDFIDSEIHDAEVYAKCALKYKESDPTLAKLFYDLSVEEMRHMDLLHGEVVRQIEQYRKVKDDPPASMQAIYNYLHEKQIDKAKGVKSCQSMYRNG